MYPPPTCREFTTIARYGGPDGDVTLDDHGTPIRAEMLILRPPVGRLFKLVTRLSWRLPEVDEVGTARNALQPSNSVPFEIACGLKFPWYGVAVQPLRPASKPPLLMYRLSEAAYVPMQIGAALVVDAVVDAVVEAVVEGVCTRSATCPSPKSLVDCMAYSTWRRRWCCGSCSKLAPKTRMEGGRFRSGVLTSRSRGGRSCGRESA